MLTPDDEFVLRRTLDVGRPHERAYAAQWLATGERPPSPCPDAPAPPALPGLLTMAANLAGSVVAHVAAGMPAVDDAAYAARLAVCSTCPNLRLPDWRCAGADGCGCYLKTKARWADQQCPLGKWG